MAIDVLNYPTASIGDLFVSDSKGTQFVVSLQDTNRNSRGIVDYENLVGLDGVGVANQVANREEVVGWGKDKQIRSLITFDDGTSHRLIRSCAHCEDAIADSHGCSQGRTWDRLKAPAKKDNGDDFACDVSKAVSVLPR